MKAVGIVAEYNPFHSGHWYQIRKIREIFGAETPVAAVMSGDFVRAARRPLTINSPARKLRCAGGVSLVIELPLPWSLSSAESFARGGVGLLGAAGVIDALSFGSESGDLSALEKTAAVLDTPEFAEGAEARTHRRNAVCRGARTGGACSSWRERGGARYAERSSGRGIHPRGGEARLYI